ncbi:hypothetical protein DPMN_084746 [Dreissena polymorpha]|uniref:VWFA domain-containing protein n=2 Tax=Dreissena polymorpha TaxID=45954 RepID=A0A9D4BJP2_DREPO|nr:hypothetical protein DPMN_084746 [Dreissena polymorpha]
MASDRQKTLEQSKRLSSISYNQVLGVGVGKYVLHEELLAITDTVRNVHPLFGDNTIVSLLKRTMFGCGRCTTSYSDVALAFDVASFGYEQLEESLKVAEVLIANIHTGINQTRISLSKTVGGIGETVFNFNKFSDSSQMIPAMYRGIMKEDSCHTKDCSSGNLVALMHHLAEELLNVTDQGRKQVAVVFTQGHVTDSERNFVLNEGKRLKENGVIIVVVSIGRDANDDLMLQLSTSSFFVFLVGEDVSTSVDVIKALVSTIEYDSCYDIQNYPIFDSLN